MAFATDNFSNTQTGFGARVSSLITAYQTRRAKSRVFRQTYAELSTLSDRDLADLGLARSEIRRVAWQAANEA
ncbi:hypothetical protein MAA8898_02915 [Maliponia aquimaris]|uniref:YjiS-like domain-containing protein n=1 Tax=Maliponia aquimaris TaxID=1673631 RepID=A0A238KMD7_9RHOB|nr:hypothetical protein MAA8898_02915 [Maliponia aquimaris]